MIEYFKRKPIATGIFLLFGLIFGYLFWATPYFNDDLLYIKPIADYYFENTTDYPWGEIWQGWVLRYNTDNIRLGNLLVVFFYTFPKWIGALCSAICLCWSIYSMGRMIRLDWNVQSIGLISFLYIICMPGWTMMFSLDFAINYIWATAFMLWAIEVFQNDKSRWRAVVLSSIIVGWWHEGFCCCTLAAFGGLLITRRLRPDVKRITMCAILLLMLLVALYTPGRQLLMNKYVESALWHIVTVPCLWWIYLVCLIGYVLIRKNRSAFFEPINIMCICAGLANIAIILKTMADVGYRTGWMANVFGILGLLWLYKKLIIQSLSFRAQQLIGIIFAAFVILHLGVTTEAAGRNSEIYNRALHIFFEKQDSIMWEDVNYYSDAPILALSKPGYELYKFDSRYHNQSIINNLFGTDHNFHVVWKGLRDFTPDNPGVEKTSSGWKINNRLVCQTPDSVTTPYVDYFYFTDWVHTFVDKAYMLPFRSEADGKMYCQIVPTFDHTIVGRIKDFRFESLE